MYSSRDKVVTFPTEVILSILEFVYFRDGIFDIETTKSCALVGFPWRKGSYYPDLGSSRHDFIRCLSLLSAERRQYVSHITRIVRIAPLLSANSRDLIDVIAALPSLEKLTVDLARSPIIESDDFTPLHKLSSLNLQSFALISSFHPSANPSLFVSLCGSWSLLERLTLSQLSMEPDWIPPDLPPFSLSELRFYMPFWLFGNANLLFAWILSNTPPSKLTMLAFADLPPSSLLTPVLDFRGRYIQSFEVGRSFGRMDGSAEKLLISVLNKCPGLRDTFCTSVSTPTPPDLDSYIIRRIIDAIPRFRDLQALHHGLPNHADEPSLSELRTLCKACGISCREDCDLGGMNSAAFELDFDQH